MDVVVAGRGLVVIRVVDDDDVARPMVGNNEMTRRTWKDVTSS